MNKASFEEFKSGKVSLTPEEREKMQKKGINPEVVMARSTEKIRAMFDGETDNTADAILEGIDMEKYTGFVKIAEFAPVSDREKMAEEVSDCINELSLYAKIEKVGRALNKLNAMHEYLIGKSSVSRKDS